MEMEKDKKMNFLIIQNVMFSLILTYSLTEIWNSIRAHKIDFFAQFSLEFSSSVNVCLNIL